MKRRMRSEIIDLNTGIKYLNESEAASSLNVSRYIIHKSITTRKICKGVMFAPFSYGMDIEFVKSLYSVDIRKKRIFTKKNTGGN